MRINIISTGHTYDDYGVTNNQSRTVTRVTGINFYYISYIISTINFQNNCGQIIRAVELHSAMNVSYIRKNALCRLNIIEDDCSGMLSCVISYKLTDVSEVFTDSINIIIRINTCNNIR